jgi:hypothetical protein
LAQLAMPQAAIALARTTYDKVRKNVSDSWDYEFTSIRFAAAVALKRLTSSEKEDQLKQVNSTLPRLFAAWQDLQADFLIDCCQASDDVGIQGIAVLALGDLYWLLLQKSPDEATRTREFLQSIFLAKSTAQPVRWAVADALSRLDVDMVVANIIQPALTLIQDNGEAHKIVKSLAYLIGLLHLRSNEALTFLRDQCLGIVDGHPQYDWSTWATALTALGRIADPADSAQLAAIASGKVEAFELSQLFPEERQNNYVRRTALDALKGSGELSQKVIKATSQLGEDCVLGVAYYGAVRDMYWRTGSHPLPAGRIPFTPKKNSTQPTR